jgi:hypothetical protein
MEGLGTDTDVGTKTKSPGTGALWLSLGELDLFKHAGEVAQSSFVLQAKRDATLLG